MPAPIPDLSRDQQCHHYQAPTGMRCGSPALKGEYYCFHHHIKHAKRASRVLIDPEITCMELPPIEDRASVFIALAAVIHRLAENTIDTRRAGQMIYALQVALKALDPAPVPRSRTRPAAQSAAESEPAANGSAAEPATDTLQPATPPRTIPITKESLLYFLRSRHCYNCNVELFPAHELTERRNAGAAPEIIEENEFMRRRNGAAKSEITEEVCAALSAPDRDSENLPGTLPTLQAVALVSVADAPANPPGPSSSTCNLQPATDNRRLRERRITAGCALRHHLPHPVCFTLT
jgi:hypothetical protein